MDDSTPAARLEAAIRSPRTAGPARLALRVAGSARHDALVELLVAPGADVLLLVAPFGEPTPDGLTPPEARAGGASVRAILGALSASPLALPVVLVSQLNPLLAYGLHRSLPDLAEVGACGLLVPDAPHDESEELRRLADRAGIGLVPLLGPAVPPERKRRIARAGVGFVAVAHPGGGAIPADWVARLRASCPVPVCAHGPLEDGAVVDGVIARG